MERRSSLAFELRPKEPNETTYAAIKASAEDDVYGPYDDMASLMDVLAKR